MNMKEPAKQYRWFQQIFFAFALITCILINVHGLHLECELKDLHNVMELARQDDDEGQNEVKHRPIVIMTSIF